MAEVKGGARIAAMVEELAAAAERVGLQVRRERLLREVGYRARGGACRLREKDLVIIDSAQPPAEQLEVLLDALRTRDSRPSTCRPPRAVCCKPNPTRPKRPRRPTKPDRTARSGKAEVRVAPYATPARR